MRSVINHDGVANGQTLTRRDGGTDNKSSPVLHQAFILINDELFELVSGALSSNTHIILHYAKINSYCTVRCNHIPVAS